MEAKRKNPSGYDDRDFWALEKGIISEKLENEFELCNRMKKIIDSTDNMIEVLCPKFVELIVKDDFYTRFKDSLDENKKLKVKKFLDIDNEKEKILKNEI